MKGKWVSEIIIGLIIFGGLLFGIVALVGGIQRATKGRIDEPTAIVPTKVVEISPDNRTAAKQKFTKVPAGELDVWLANCNERVVSITPLMHNKMDLAASLDGYLVVTE